MQLRYFLLLSILGSLPAQEPNWKIANITVRGEAPIHAPTCTASEYGYLHIGDRTQLTTAELGDYWVSETAKGKILTIYPESKSGIFVYADCPKTP